VWSAGRFSLPNYEEPQLTTEANSVTGTSKSRKEASSLPFTLLRDHGQLMGCPILPDASQLITPETVLIASFDELPQIRSAYPKT